MDDAGFWRKRGNDCSSYEPGLYTWQEISQMIFVDGYIPVANATEFDKIRTGNAETMGAGTCWEGTYTTGGNKKYVQVLAIDFTSFGTWSTPNNFNGTYDGNEIAIFNLTSTHALFNGTGEQFYYNIRLLDCSQIRAANNSGLICHTYLGGEMINCTAINCTVNATNFVGGLLNCSNLQYDFTCTNNSFNGTISASSAAGGLIGVLPNSSSFTVSITNCHNYGTVSCSANVDCGGILGRANNCTVSQCSNTGNLTGRGHTGGICGDAQGGVIITECTVDGVTLNSTGGIPNTITGGIAGRASNADNVFTKNRVSNCTLVNNTSGVNQSCGGIVGTGGGTNNVIAECKVINCDITTAQTFAGGILGRIRNSTGNAQLIENCEVIGGTINGSNNRGGITGHWGVAGNQIVNCLSTAEISLPHGGLDGGLVGQVSSGSAIAIDSYWDIDASLIAVSARGTGKTTSELQTPTSNTGIYANWDPNVWDFGTSSDYPKLTTTP